jgi:hypothetical protein
VDALIILLIFLALGAATWRWGSDSRVLDERDRYWWPNG